MDYFEVPLLDLIKENQPSAHYENVLSAMEDCDHFLKDKNWIDYKKIKSKKVIQMMEYVTCEDESSKQKAFKDISILFLTKYIFLKNLKANELIVNEFLKSFLGHE